MTVQPRRIATPAELAAAMGAPWHASDQQWAAITAPLAPAVVIAGAGSGKTTLMAARVVYLVLTGAVRPDQVLGLTFTTKAASELRGRIRQALTDAGALDDSDPDAEDVLEPTVATYNAYAAGLLTDHGLRIGHEPDTRVITDAARYQLGARVVDRHTGEVAFLSDHPKTVIQNLLDLDGSMSEHLVGPDDVRRVDAEALAGFRAAAEEERAGKNRSTYVDKIESAANAIERRGELLGLVDGYRRMKSDLGLMDFSDQIELGARLAEDQPEVGVAEREKFKVVLLDEYQDTSVAQATMLSRLFGGGHAVTAVGDPNQAIYGWRGASVSNILGFAETFPAGDGAVPSYPLTVNRRSDRRILTVANRLAAPLYAATTAVRPLEPKPEAAEGVVATRVFETQREELAWLAGAVREAHGGPETQRWSDIGVLTRDNAHAAEVFDALTEAGIPVEIVGLSGLLRLPEVAEVVAVLHLLKDVTSNSSLLTLLTGPRWAIGPRDLKLLGDRARELAGGRGRSSNPTSIDDHLVAIADGIDPAEIACLDDALNDPGEATYSDAGARAVRPARRRAADAALARRGAAPRHRAPDHRHDRRRRRARVGGQPVRRRTARQPRPVRPGRRRLPGGRRRRHPRRPPGLPDRRGGGEQGARGRGSVRRRLGQAADRPPRQGAGVVGGVPRRRLRRAVPELAVADAVDLLAGRPAGSPAW